MRKLFLFVLIIVIFLVNSANVAPLFADTKFWSVQSIDTMKYSRDASRDAKISSQIDTQVKNIAATGATHVAIDTPYDLKFLPRLKEWVAAARKYNLNVWFRGNFSGWEGWFDYPKTLTRAEHLQMTQSFISNNPDLFQNGDIFTACPECENGGVGDPRQTGDVSGFRQFMIAEYHATNDAFRSINKQVTTNYDSMNGDVARLVMDSATTAAIGGVVTIDHYVVNGTKLASDIADIASKSGGKIMLGEFGSPIPDINGNQTEEQQAGWINDAFSRIINEPELIGMNYWVNLGGSTSPWNPDGTPRKAVAIIQNFYSPKILAGQVFDDTQTSLKNVTISYLGRVIKTNSEGRFELPYVDTNMQINFSSSYSQSTESASQVLGQNGKVTLKRPSTNIFQGILNFFQKFFHF